MHVRDQESIVVLVEHEFNFVPKVTPLTNLDEVTLQKLCYSKSKSALSLTAQVVRDKPAPIKFLIQY